MNLCSRYLTNSIAALAGIAFSFSATAAFGQETDADQGKQAETQAPATVVIPLNRNDQTRNILNSSDSNPNGPNRGALVREFGASDSLATLLNPRLAKLFEEKLELEIQVLKRQLEELEDRDTKNIIRETAEIEHEIAMRELDRLRSMPTEQIDSVDGMTAQKPNQNLTAEPEQPDTSTNNSVESWFDSIARIKAQVKIKSQDPETMQTQISQVENDIAAVQLALEENRNELKTVQEELEQSGFADEIKNKASLLLARHQTYLSQIDKLEVSKRILLNQKNSESPSDTKWASVLKTLELLEKQIQEALK